MSHPAAWDAFAAAHGVDDVVDGDVVMLDPAGHPFCIGGRAE
jgi:hypothetical protein